jgi:hypothetical protein
MPFLAECLFCKGKVRVPDHALGQSLTCPRCASAFTLVPMENPPEISEAKLIRLPATAGTLPTFTATPDANDAPGLEEPQEKDDPRPPIQPAVFAGALAFFLASAAAVCLSFPSLRAVTLCLSSLAAVGGLVAWRTAPGSRAWIPAAGTTLSLPVLLVATFWPYMLSTSVPPPRHTGDLGPLDKRPIVAVAIEGEKEEPAPPWIDAAKFCAQQGDMRVRVLSAGVEPRPGHRPKNSPPLLQLALRLSNVGTGRTINYHGWGKKEGEQGQPAVVRDNANAGYKVLPAAPLSGGGLLRTAHLGPGESLKENLAFEPPPPKSIQFLRLELPAAAIGGTGVLHFQVPRDMIEWREPAEPPAPEKGKP